MSRGSVGAVALRRHDVVVFVQAFYLVRVERDGAVAPAEADVGVMPLRLGDLADAIDEGEGLGEILEFVCALDTRPRSRGSTPGSPATGPRPVRATAAGCRLGTACIADD